MKKIKGVIVGVGGQGIILLTRILGEACVKAGIPIILSEVHGMAQRGGVVESSVSIGGKSPYVGEGEADFIIALEPAEALRFIKRAKKQATLLVNTAKIIPSLVKEGLGEYPDLEPFFEQIKAYFNHLYFVNAEELAKKAGNAKAVNVVMLGCASGLGILPVPVEVIKETICKLLPERLHEVNLKAFELGYNYFNKN